MALVAAAGAAEPPRYLHEPAATVPLAWPFDLDGRTVERVLLVHPTLDGLEFLRGENQLSARMILQVTSTLPLRAIGCLRWPDVEVVLAEAMALLPPDLVAQVEAAEEPEAEPANDPPVDDPVDVADQLDLNPGDFSTEI